MSEGLAPTGLARRGRRLPDHEPAQRMLRTAVDMVHRTGLTVSLDHISLEDVIREAGVSRSAVYRRWPYKDLFFSDLVRELATNATPKLVEDELAMIRDIVAARLDWLDTPERRWGRVIELFRRLALLATFMSLADGDLRDQVQAALGESERAHLARIAKAWGQLAGLFGYRLRPELGATFATLAPLLSASMRGLVIMALSMPEIATQRTAAAPFGAAAQEEWSLPAIGLASIASSFL